LLDQWQDQFNKYRGADKRRVLQQLALYQQKNSTEHLQDRRSIDYSVVLEQIGLLLPSLSLDPKNDSMPLLNELVERSGLFLRVDRGDRYQFAHLTSQEYFAAEALVNKSDDLVELFKQDPMNWREVVKLWCGIAGDSTSLIMEIYKLDGLLAFECLADAQEVKQSVADSIVNHFQDLLGRSASQEELARAFGAVAASDRKLGKDVFQFLSQSISLIHPKKGYHLKPILQAISFTNKEQGADLLSLVYDGSLLFVNPFSSKICNLTDKVAGQQLVRMGDLAVPGLAYLVSRGLHYAINDLYSIGTTKAAEALVPMLWMESSEAQSMAALCLASLLQQPMIEDELNNYSIDKLNYIDAPKDEILVKHMKKLGKSSIDGRITNINHDERKKKFTWIWELFKHKQIWLW
jgi:hypothetical protein